MPERGENEVFSNPLPPAGHRVSTEEDADDEHPLTNEDFRKMLMTPKAGSTTSYTETVKHARKEIPVAPEEGEEEDAATRRKKKKSYYAKLKRDEEERQKELESKYRDRAKERREGHNKDYSETEVISTTADYRAVAPDAKAIENNAERRKQVIQASKYLGGDMEHTHLVKGLDYALLEKVRAEITSKEREDEDMMETVVSQPKEEEDPEEKITFKTKLGRNIYRTLFRNRVPQRNELFLPRRMAYVIALEDEFAESDIPATLIRSKADCPSLQATTTLTTNDIVINKLTQILSYLRQGKREAKKLKKKEKGKLKEEEKARITALDDSIYGEIGDYEPSFAKPKDKREKDRKDKDRDSKSDRDRDRDRGRDRERDRERERDRDRDRRDYRDRDRERERDRGRDRERERERTDRIREPEREKPQRKSYFEKPVEEDDLKEKPKETAIELVKSINERFKGYADVEEEKEKVKVDAEKNRLQKLKAKTGIDSYAECYPGMAESADAIDDSDEEVDFTKMDQGNKKGPVGRWDFDTAEEYSDYMSNREALPKAAFQYGVKMSDGRRTRRTGPKDEKQKLDRELQQIQRIIEKRKPSGADGGGSDAKHAKY
ncbi:protein Red isoform X2 [Aplysia californica]|uniref:Protein Red isoform X2 n=1 Tax=Aplysia californica TaxID=6500 RepID=A0ABM0JMR6_APLCA|nr:protein Red isoform X2 [Aplysia californica]